MNFKCRETEKIFHREFSRWLPLEIQERATLKLKMMNNARTLDEFTVFPSNHFKLLRGYKDKRYSIRINKQWRIRFVWQNGNIYEVEIVDYH